MNDMNMTWNIVTDSACDLPPAPQNGVGFASVPFVIRIGDRDYVDDENMDALAMLEAMEQSKEASHTSCPSPGAWAAQFEKAKHSIAVTISGNLSGSLNSAIAARDMVLSKHPDKHIAVLDSRSTGPEIVLCVNRLFALIKEGMHFQDIIAKAQAFLDDTHTAFMLSSFENLVKNGRMSRVVGFIVHKLGMRAIGVASEEGTIAIKGKARGEAKALDILLEDMRQRGFAGGAVVISHCQSESLANKLGEKIIGLWQSARVTILPTRGLDSYYAERGGLIVAY